MKRSIYVISLVILSVNLTACSNFNSDISQITTELDRMFTNLSVKYQEWFASMQDRYEIEKDNVKELWKDRNLNSPDVDEEIKQPNEEGQEVEEFDSEENNEMDNTNSMVDIDSTDEEMHSNGQGFVIVTGD